MTDENTGKDREENIEEYHLTPCDLNGHDYTPKSTTSRSKENPVDNSCSSTTTHTSIFCKKCGKTLILD